MSVYFERLYISIFRQLQGPYSIEWFPTYNCNSRCQYCGGYDRVAKDAFGQIIPYEEIMAIVKESGRAGISIWNIGGRGGEPLLYPNLIEVLNEIKKNNMDGILITNGILLKEEFIKKLVDFKWDILRLSLDSHIPDVHDRIRGINGSFDKIDKALDLFKFFKKEFNTRLPEIIACPVVTCDNYRFIDGYIEYCKEKCINEIQFMPLINVHERAEKLTVTEGQKKELTDILERRLNENGIKHNIHFAISLYKIDNEKDRQELNPEAMRAQKLYCIHLWKTLVISEDGYLSPCSLIKDKLFKIHGSLLEAWGSRIMNELRAKILNGENISPACRDCCGPLRQETLNFNRYISENSAI